MPSYMEYTENVIDEAAQEDMYKARLARCVPVAKKIIGIVTKNLESIAVGDGAECSKSLNDTASEVLSMYVDENINWGDKGFIMQLVLQPFGHLNEKLETSLSISWDKAIGNVFGKDAMDLTFAEVNDILKAGKKEVE